jgi:hypothetical protein
MMWIIDIVLDCLSAGIPRSAEEITPTPKALITAYPHQVHKIVS